MTVDIKALDLLTSLEKSRGDAMRGGDVAALDAMLSETLAYGHTSGLRDDKPFYMNSLKSGTVQYKGIAFSQLAVVAAQDDMLVGTGRMAADILKGGAPLKVDAIYLVVWQRQGGTWRMAAFQGARAPA